MFPKPPRKLDPDVIRVLNEYRQALVVREDDMMREMAGKWLEIENKLNADIALLAQEMQRQLDAGKSITPNLVTQSNKYKALKAQIQAEIKKYNADYALPMLKKAQEEYAILGIDAAQNAITISTRDLFPKFTRINKGAVESLIGFTKGGAPLSDLLKADYPDALSGLTNALINGIARGQGPVATARQMADGMGMGLERAILIARTETVRAYRTANTLQYRESGVVNGFKRLVWKPTACMGCLMLDGQVFDVAEELEDHPAGKCTVLAIIPGAPVYWEKGPQWFKTLSPEEQSSRMGPEKFQLWKDGKIKLEDLSRMQHSDVWGDSPRVANLKELLGGL